jgi:hypothetical protein
MIIKTIVFMQILALVLGIVCLTVLLLGVIRYQLKKFLEDKDFSSTN